MGRDVSYARGYRRRSQSLLFLLAASLLIGGAFPSPPPAPVAAQVDCSTRSICPVPGRCSTLHFVKQAYGGDGKFWIRFDHITGTGAQNQVRALDAVICTQGGFGEFFYDYLYEYEGWPVEGFCIPKQDLPMEGNCTFLRANVSIPATSRAVELWECRTSNGDPGWFVDLNDLARLAGCDEKTDDCRIPEITVTYENECKGGSGGPPPAGDSDVTLVKRTTGGDGTFKVKLFYGSGKEGFFPYDVLITTQNGQGVSSFSFSPVTTSPFCFSVEDQAVKGNCRFVRSECRLYGHVNGKPVDIIASLDTCPDGSKGWYLDTKAIMCPEKKLEGCKYDINITCTYENECRKGADHDVVEELIKSLVQAERPRPAIVAATFIAVSPVRTASSDTTSSTVPRGLLLVDSGTDQLRVYLLKRDGTFALFKRYGTGSRPVAVAAGDFNRDGKTDAVVANSLADSLSLFLGNGDGTFQRGRQIALPGIRPVGLAVADFDGDERLDLAVAQNESSDVAVLMGRGDGTFRPPAVIPLAEGRPSSILAADWNEDGTMDLIVTAVETISAVVFLQNERGRFLKARQIEVGSDDDPSYLVASAVGDFNGDGHLDVAAANLLGSVIFLLSRNQSNRLDFTRVDVSGVETPTSITSGQFFGAAGVAVPNFTSNTVTLITFEETRPKIARRIRAVSEPVSISQGDFDSNGILDLVVAGLPVGSLASLLGRENGTFLLKR